MNSSNKQAKADKAPNETGCSIKSLVISQL